MRKPNTQQSHDKALTSGLQSDQPEPDGYRILTMGEKAFPDFVRQVVHISLHQIKRRFYLLNLALEENDSDKKRVRYAHMKPTVLNLTVNHRLAGCKMANYKDNASDRLWFPAWSCQDGKIKDFCAGLDRLTDKLAMMRAEWEAHKKGQSLSEKRSRKSDQAKLHEGRCIDGNIVLAYHYEEINGIPTPDSHTAIPALVRMLHNEGYDVFDLDQGGKRL